VAKLVHYSTEYPPWGRNAIFRLPTSHTGFSEGIRPVDPHVLGKPGLRAARCTNDQRHWSTWGEYLLDPVTVEDQNAVFRLLTSHTGFLAEIEPVDPHMLRKPRLQAARCANNQRNQSTWGAYMPDSVLFEGKNAVFRLPTSHTGFFAELRPVDPHVLGKPGLRAARCTNDQCHRSSWGEYMLDPVTVEDQNAVFRLPTSHTRFLAGIEPVDPHMLRKPGPQAARCTNDQLHQSTWGAYMPDSVLFEGPHFDGLVRAPLTGPRISMATHICLESPLYTVSANTSKSGIRFILGSLYRFWSKPLQFWQCSPPHPLEIFVHIEKSRKPYINGIDFQELTTWRSWFTIPLNTPPVTVLTPVAGSSFCFENRAIFSESFFRREIPSNYSFYEEISLDLK